ncbi:hypothetical protein BCR32DRAFT_292134 [Anaeromyces robustus]|uniref:Uncharacterized protein n=1 Tax=Anaeromyces robustus TaxID=1754192 RepID=A0A1Y1XCS7_9FUNG|nr:hypothetical protein BCR32DRAFT_292134 [Anaeromyces robustus]|eukprot:ORX83236.1 hypothetical protein BCR32DRAFT_292134 [Anaeromyces robustus]
MLTPEEFASLNNRTQTLYPDLVANEQKYFIKSGSLVQWLFSKGTDFDCYVRFVNDVYEDKLYKVNIINDKIDQLRIIFYAILKPFQSQFFYWTLLLLIMYKFNTRRPVMKLVLYHYIFRVIGDIIEQLGNLMPYYHRLDKDGSCLHTLDFTEQHPFKWFLTRQINSFFWYTGEIIGDWYPLLRTKSVTKNRRSLRLLYGSCILYNITKLIVPLSQLYVSPTKLYINGVYNNDYVNGYYNFYWCLQSLIILASVFYESIVYFTLKKELFDKTNSDYGFLKKFRTMSEFRIVVSAVVLIIAFPLLFLSSCLKVIFYYHDDLKYLNYSLEDFRLVITNVQYMIIFIDQILLNTKSDRNNRMMNSCSCSCSCKYCCDKQSQSKDYDNYYNTAILHSKDENVKKIVFRNDDDNDGLYRYSDTNNYNYNINGDTIDSIRKNSLNQNTIDYSIKNSFSRSTMDSLSRNNISNQSMMDSLNRNKNINRNTMGSLSRNNISNQSMMDSLNRNKNINLNTIGSLSRINITNQSMMDSLNRNKNNNQYMMDSLNRNKNNNQYMMDFLNRNKNINQSLESMMDSLNRININRNMIDRGIDTLERNADSLNRSRMFGDQNYLLRYKNYPNYPNYSNYPNYPNYSNYN